MNGPAEQDLLRELARRVADLAALPEMAARRRRLAAHNRLEDVGPLVLIFPEGAWGELIPEASLRCASPVARRLEIQLRRRLYWWDQLRDDGAFDPWLNIGWRIDDGGYGVPIPHEHGDLRGSYRWDPPLKNLGDDLARLHHRRPTLDRAGSQADFDEAKSLIGGILPIRHRGQPWWTMGMTQTAIKLCGMEQLLTAMADDPDGVERLMAFLLADHQGFLDWCEREGVLGPNSRGDHIGSGALGYCDELPDHDGGLRSQDLWALSESQETVGCSPRMFGRLIFPWQKKLMERFGLVCYGCCEPVHQRLDAILSIPRLRRLSISPWCKLEPVAERVGAGLVFSRKPNPAMVCAEFDEAAIRADLRHAYDVSRTHGCRLEIVLKDTHTIQNEPWRLQRWLALAYEERGRTA